MANGQNPFKRQVQPPGVPPKGDAPYYPTEEEFKAASQRPLGTPSPLSRQNRRKFHAERKIQQQKAAEQREINRVNARQNRANAEALEEAKAQFIRQQGVDPKEVDRIDVDPQGGLRMLMKRKLLRHEIDKDTGETQAIFRNENNQEERHSVLNKAGQPIKNAGLKLDRNTGHQYVDIKGIRHIVRENLNLKDYYDWKAKEKTAKEEEQDALDVEGDLEKSLAKANAEIKAAEKWLSDMAKKKQSPGDIPLVDEKKKELEALTKDRDRISGQHEEAITDYRAKRKAHSRAEDNPVQYRTAIDFPRYSAIAPPTKDEDPATAGARGSLGIEGEAYQSEDPPIQVEGTTLKVDPYEGYYKSTITIPGGYTQHIYYPKTAGKQMSHTPKTKVLYDKFVEAELAEGTPPKEAHALALKKYPLTATGVKGREAELERLEKEYAKLEKEWEDFKKKTDPATGVPEQTQSSIKKAQELQDKLAQSKEELDAAKYLSPELVERHYYELGHTPEDKVLYEKRVKYLVKAGIPEKKAEEKALEKYPKTVRTGDPIPYKSKVTRRQLSDLAARAGLPAGILVDRRFRIHAIGEAARSKTSALDKEIAIKKRTLEGMDLDGILNDPKLAQRVRNLEASIRQLKADRERVVTALNADLYGRLGVVDGATLNVPIQTKLDEINKLNSNDLPKYGISGEAKVGLEGFKENLKTQAAATAYGNVVREMSAGVGDSPHIRESLLHLLKGYRGADPNVLNNKELKEYADYDIPFHDKRSYLEYALEKLASWEDLNKQELIAIGHHLSRLGVKGVPEVVMRRGFSEMSQEDIEEFARTRSIVLENGVWKKVRQGKFRVSDRAGKDVTRRLDDKEAVAWDNELGLEIEKRRHLPVIDPSSAEELASWVQENIIPFRHVFKSGQEQWTKINRAIFEDEGSAWKHIAYDKESNAGYYFRYKEQSKGQVMQFKVDQELGDVTNPGKVIEWTLPKDIHKAPGQLGELMLSHVSENLGVAADWMSAETLKSTGNRLARDTGKVWNSMEYGAILTAAKLHNDPGAMEAVMAVQRKNDERLDRDFPVSLRDSFKAISDEKMQWRHGMSSAASQILVTALMAPVGAGVTVSRVGLITMPKTLGRWGAFGFGTLPNFSYQLKGGMEDAIAHGVSAEDAFNKAFATAAIIAPVDTASNFMMLGGGKVIKKLIPQATLRRTQASLLKSIGLGAVTFGAKAAVEGETERLQTYIENWNAKHWSGYDKDRWIHEGTGMAASIGYGFGAFMAAPSTAFQAFEARKRAKKFLEIEEAVEEVQKAAQGGTAAKRAYNEKVGGKVFTDVDLFDQAQALKERRAGLPMELLGVDADTLAPILVDSGLSPEAQDSVIEMIAEGDIAALAALALSYKISAPSTKRAREVDKVLAETGEVTGVRSGTAQGIIEGSIFLTREVESILNTGSATNAEAAGILVEIGLAIEQANGQLKINSKAAQVLPPVIASRVLEESNKAAQGSPTFAEPSTEAVDPRVEDLINEGRDNLKDAAEEIVNAPLPESWNVTLQDPNNPDQSFPIVVEASTPEAAQEMANNMVAPGGIFPGHAIQSIDLIEQDERNDIERDTAQQQDQEMGVPQAQPPVPQEAQVPQAELEEAPAAPTEELLEGVNQAQQELDQAQADVNQVQQEVDQAQQELDQVQQEAEPAVPGDVIDDMLSARKVADATIKVGEKHQDLARAQLTLGHAKQKLKQANAKRQQEIRREEAPPAPGEPVAPGGRAAEPAVPGGEGRPEMGRRAGAPEAAPGDRAEGVLGDMGLPREQALALEALNIGLAEDGRPPATNASLNPPPGLETFVAGWDAIGTGRRIVFADIPTNLSGAVQPGHNVIFINRLSNQRLDVATVGHEFVHTLSPELYAELLTTIRKLAKTRALRLPPHIEEAYARAYGTDLAKLEEEALANLVGDLFLEEGFWKALAKKEKGLFRKLYSKFIEYVSDAARLFTMHWGQAGFGQIEEMQLQGRALTKAHNALADVMLASRGAKAALKRGGIKFALDDFGKKIGGARKDLALADRLADPVEGENVTIAKDFPKPNYKKMIKEGFPAEALATVAAIRDSIPRKPTGRRQSRARARWVREFNEYRAVAGEILADPSLANLNEEDLAQKHGVPAMVGPWKADGSGTEVQQMESRNWPNILKRASFYQGLGFPAFGKASKWWMEGRDISQRNVADLFPEETNPDVLSSYLGQKIIVANNPDSEFAASYYNRRVGPGSQNVIVGDRTEEEAYRELGELTRPLIEGAEKKPRVKRQIKFSAYQDHRTGDIFVGKKGRVDVIRFKEGFNTSQEAFQYIEDNRAELEEQWDKIRNVQERGEENLPRTAPQETQPRMVDGEIVDATPDMFQDAFGFYGVEFGNWVEGSRRQEDLNRAYDSLFDLARAIGVPTKALSLNGTLGLAFGARGRGSKAAAHYEPSRIVINLTKNSGPGSLAHEWFHGVDNYFARINESGLDGNRDPLHKFASEELHPQFARPEIAKAWRELENKLSEGEFSQRSFRLDQGRTKPYFSQTLEKAARAFEKYAKDKLAESQIVNDYLVNINEDPEGPYPTNEEMSEGGITQALDNLFDTVETQSTKTGVAMFALDVPDLNPKNSAEQKAFDLAGSAKKKRNQQLAVAAVRLAKGEMPIREYTRYAETLNPWQTMGAPSRLLSDDEFKRLAKRKVGKATLLSKNKWDKLLAEVPDGTLVEARIDIPAFELSMELVRQGKLKEPFYVVALHKKSDSKDKAGEVLSYLPYAFIDERSTPNDVQFITRPLARRSALDIAQGEAKDTIATVRGRYRSKSKYSPEMLLKEINKPGSGWTEVGYEPTRSSEFRGLAFPPSYNPEAEYFTDVTNWLPVESGSASLSVGNRVWVKNAKFTARLPEEGERLFKSPGGGKLPLAKFALDVDDTRYMELAKDPEKNREELQRMVDGVWTDNGRRRIIRSSTEDPHPLVPKTGEPIAIEAHHTTPRPKTLLRTGKFDERFLGSTHGAPNDRLGWYFSSSPLYGDDNEYAGSRGESLPFRLYFDNPLVVDFDFIEDERRTQEIERQMEMGGHDGIVTVVTGRGLVGSDTRKNIRSAYDVAVSNPRKDRQYSEKEFEKIIEQDNILNGWMDGRGRSKASKMSPREIAKKLPEVISFLDRASPGFSDLFSKRESPTRESASELWYVAPTNLIGVDDPVTYDKKGNIIPLSQRFDPAKKDIRFALDVDDTRYMELAKDPKKNRAELRAMLNSKADHLGQGRKLFHHASTSKGFTEFETPSYFEPAQYEDEELGEWASAEFLGMLETGEVESRKFYLDIHAPKVVTTEDIWEEPYSNTDPDYFEMSKSARETAEAYGMDTEGPFDGWISEEGEQIVATSPTQIKSADLVTRYTKEDEAVISGEAKAGDIIPLSKRFDPFEKDIRFALDVDDTRHMELAEELRGKGELGYDTVLGKYTGDPDKKAKWEELQRIVDAKAKAAGLKGPFFRGHDEDINPLDTKLDTPTFTAERDVAAAYAFESKEAPGIMEERGDDARDGVVTEVYLDTRDYYNLDEPTGTITKEETLALFDEIGANKDQRSAILSSIWSAEPEEWVDSMGEVTFDEASDGAYLDFYRLADNPTFRALMEKAGYKGLSYHGMFHGGFKDEAEPREFRPFASNQVKLADPMTRDADGNIIPLSQRFDLTRDSTRFALDVPIEGGQTILPDGDRTMIPGTVFFAGGGLVEVGLPWVNWGVVVEYDPELAAVHKKAHGSNPTVQDVAEFVNSSKNLNRIPKNGYFHASPVCKGYSPINQHVGDSDLDIVTAEAVAKVIRERTPAIFTLENVKEYAYPANKEALDIITKALEEGGYTWHGQVYNAADFGASTDRKRYLLRATRHGELPPVPQPTHGPTTDTPHVGWYDVVEDLIEDLPDMSLASLRRAKYIYRSFRDYEGGIDPENVPEPILVAGSALHYRVKTARPNEPLFTLLADSNDILRILLPGGRVKKVTSRVKARLTGLPDSYPLPSDSIATGADAKWTQEEKNSERTSKIIVGNGVPPALAAGVFGPLIQQEIARRGETPRFALDVDDTRYMELAKDPEKNREELQQMVDAKAEDAGYITRPVYHGTAEKFTEFKITSIEEFEQKWGIKASEETIPPTMLFFAPRSDPQDKRESGVDAETFAGVAASKTGGKPRVISAYLKINKLFKIETEEDAKKLERLGATGIRELGYDAVARYAKKRLDDGRVVPSLWEVAVFDSSQVKSADPVTYDDQGNVIPLSQRFDPAKKDIRFALDVDEGAKLSAIKDPTAFSEALDRAPRNAILGAYPSMLSGDWDPGNINSLAEKVEEILTPDSAPDHHQGKAVLDMQTSAAQAVAGVIRGKEDIETYREAVQLRDMIDNWESHPSIKAMVDDLSYDQAAMSVIPAAKRTKRQENFISIWNRFKSKPGGAYAKAAAKALAKDFGTDWKQIIEKGEVTVVNPGKATRFALDIPDPKIRTSKVGETQDDEYGGIPDGHFREEADFGHPSLMAYLVDARTSKAGFGEITINWIGSEEGDVRGGASGRQMLTWLRERYPNGFIYADSVVEDTERFYNKMMAEGLIDAWEEGPEFDERDDIDNETHRAAQQKITSDNYRNLARNPEANRDRLTGYERYGLIPADEDLGLGKARFALDVDSDANVTMGVNINDSSQPFTEQILSGEKTIETRNTNSLKRNIGRRVGIVRTGQGAAQVVGYATIGEPKIYSSVEEFRKDADKHLVEPGSEFDITDQKFGYPLENVTREETPYPPIGHGIVTRRIRAAAQPRQWEVIDPRSGGKRVGGPYKTRSAASRGQDRFDNKYGGYRYEVREITPAAPGRATRFALDVEKDFPMSSLNLLHGAATHPKTRSINRVGKALEQLAIKKWGRIITSLDITEEEKQEIIDNGVEEFLAALEASGKNAGKSAADWYSIAIEVAMEVASLIHPELNNAEAARQSKGFENADDPVKAANLVMRIALAATSQNLNVDANAQYAEEQFEFFKKTGKFNPAKAKKYGEKAKSISGNLDLANKLIKKVGFEEAENFIRQSVTVRELEALVKKKLGVTKTIAGKKDDLVNGAAIFGPKIGQGFLQNLMAVFDPVTIDLWLRRTWGRWTGNVMGVAFTEERTAGFIKAVRLSRNPKLKLPGSWSRIRLIKGKRKTSGEEYDTVSEELIEKIETDTDFRDEILEAVKEWNTIWQYQYRKVSFSQPEDKSKPPNGRPVTKESKRLIDALNQPERDGGGKNLTKEQKIAREKVWNTILKSQEKMEKKAEKAWKKLGRDGRRGLQPGKWRDKYFRENGHTEELSNDDIGKIKPEWAFSVQALINAASTIDIPAAQDRRVITEIINRIGDKLKERGHETTNADIQAILWFPEKDLWAKMSGKDESNLNSSYDEEFKKIAIDKGYGKAEVEGVAEKAERTARKNRASRSGGKPDRGATRQVRGRSDRADGQKAKRAGKTRFALDVDPPQFSLDPSQSAEIYRVKRQALEDARNKRSKIQKATKGLEKGAKLAVQEPGYLIRAAIQGKYDLMDTMSARQGGSGEAGQALRRGELNQSLGESAINQYAQRLSRELKNLLGISAWRFIARKKRLNKFSRDLHTVAARLNAVAINPDGSFAFEGFDQRVGFMEENEAHAMGVSDGGYVNIQGRILQLQWNQDKEGYILLERYTAEEQQMFYDEFMQEYPDLGIFLNRWIAPGMENARHVGPQGVETPVFNRYSLHNFYSGTVYGDPGQLPGYTPDVVQRTIIGGLLWGIARAATGKLPGKRFGFLAGKKSSARTVKTGAAREQGFSMDMIKGFNVRAMEAHMEDIRRNQALDLIRSATKPVPANNVVPEHHVRVDKVAMNQLLRGLVETLGKKSAEGLALNELWNKAVENKDPSHVLLDESQRKFSQREKAIVEFLFGDERAIDLLGSDRMMDRVNWNQLTNNMADRAYNHWTLGLLAQQVGEYTASLLVGPATIAFNWLAPQIQAITAGMHRLLRSVFYAIPGPGKDWNRAEIELRAGLETLLGLLTRRVTGWEGINMFLPGADKVRGSLTQADHAKGTLGLIKEGQIGKAIKRATDRRRAYGDFVPREMFNDTALMSALQAGETGTDSVLQNLMNLKPGTAILQAVKFSEMDTTVKQNLVYSAYKAHAAVAARKAKVPRSQRKAWIQDYMRRISKENPNIHKEAFDTAMLFAFDYSNVPLLFSAKDKSQGGKILLRGLAMFSGFIYNYAKLLYTLSPAGWGMKMAKSFTAKGKKDVLGGSEARNATASAAMFAMGMMLFSEDDEPEDEDEETKRKKRYAPNIFGTSWTKWGDEIEAWWAGTGGKISIDALDEMFGTSIANSIRAYLEANGASDAEGMEIWLRGRSLPYVQYMGAFATLGQTIQGKRKAPQALGEIGEMVGDFLPSGPLQTIFGVENKYNRTTPHRYRVADIGYDMVSARLFPAPWRKAATSYVDPVMRRKSPSESLGTDYTLWDHLKRSTPYLSTQIPPAATVNSFKLKPGQEMPEAHAANLAKLMEMDLQPETVYKQTVDEFGNTTIAYVDPDQIKIKSKGEWYLHQFARTQGIDKVERVLAYYDLTKEEIEKIVAKNEKNDQRRKQGKPVAEKYWLTEKERIRLAGWQAYKESKDFALMMEQYMDRDLAILPDLINPSTRQIGEGGKETQLRPNQYWTVDEYNQLLRDVIKRQPRNTFEKMIDPNTGNELDVDTKGAIDLGHISGRAWKDIAKEPKYRGLTPKEIAKLELNPEYYVLEESWHNRKMGRESARKAIYKKELPEGALKP